MTSAAFPAFEVWGLTGGIAAGKSQAARFFREAGIPVIDADRIARELGQPGGAAHAAIVARFGTDDRKRLREIVFADAAARRDLEAILHPLIVRESLQRMEVLASGACSGHGTVSGSGKLRVIYEAALLVETGRYHQLSGLLVVDAPREVRRARLISRDGVAPELADQILAAQAGDGERLAAATDVLRNTGSLEELRTQVQAWIRQAGWA